jgi:DNA-binding NarL/FixJ family response regulator
MNIVAIAKDGNHALELLENTDVDIALVDLKMEGMCGTELIKHIKKIRPEIKILVLTSFYDEKDIAGNPDENSGENPSCAKFYSLTPREREICEEISKGNYKQIAWHMHISEGTLKNHISAIYKKTGIHDRTQLAIEFLACR